MLSVITPNLVENKSSVKSILSKEQKSFMISDLLMPGLGPSGQNYNCCGAA